MADTWEFAEWCKEYELSEETIQLLQSKGFSSYKTISRLTVEKVSQYFGKELNKVPAQLLMLEAAVELISPSEAPAKQGRKDPALRTNEGESSSQAEQKDLASAAKNGATLSSQEVAQLLQDNTPLASSFVASAPTVGQSAQAEGPTGEHLFGDPYQFGRDRFALKKRQVVDYVSSLNRGEDTTIVNLGGVEFRSSAVKKPQHDRLSLAQYVEGALRVLRAMVIEDGATMDHAIDYINYIVQIAVFAQTYAWPNVLAYDLEYRTQQQELGFRWASGSAFLMASRLQKPAPVPVTNKKTSGPSRSAHPRDPKSGTPVCQRYNGVNGCTLSRCNFAHVCRSCFSDHPEWQHKQKISATDAPKN